MRMPGLLLLLCASPAFSAYLEVHGVRMYYETHGAGRPVLLLHGGLATIRLSFEKQIPMLAQNHRVIAIEQMGHGHTPDVEGRAATYEGMTEDTAAFLERLGVRDVDVIGWSDGGQIALRLAFTHPELVRRVVASGVGLSASSPAEAEHRKRTMETLASNFWPVAAEEYARVSPDGKGHWEAFFAKLRAMWGGASWGVTETDLGKIRAPALIVAGDQESVEAHTQIFRGIKGARLFVLPGTGHATFSTRPDLLNPVILEFLDRN